MSDVAWLFVAVIVVWVAIGGYLVSLSVRQRKIEARMGELTGSDDPA